MILIAPASYVSNDLVSEFGKIPVGMLPLQNRYLYEHQVKSLSSYKEAIYMSLPSDYTLSKIGLEKFSNLDVSIIFVDATFSYGESICYILNEINRHDQPIIILDGDSLFSKNFSSSKFISSGNIS